MGFALKRQPLLLFKDLIKFHQPTPVFRLNPSPHKTRHGRVETKYLNKMALESRRNSKSSVLGYQRVYV